jgi:hypothetical protein
MAGCGSPYKSVSLAPTDLFKERSKNAVNSASPSWQTRQTLRLMFLDESYRKDPKQVISTLEQAVKMEPKPEVRMALAELLEFILKSLSSSSIRFFNWTISFSNFRIYSSLSIK